jgi:DNA mismatch endonuclease (patch repair protein)
MSDIFTRQKRSEVMARIRSRGNCDTELALARLLRTHGITGWRRHVEIRGSGSGRRNFRVRPDFVFRREKLAIFVDGCFWHGCPKHATWPATRAAWWRKKIIGNKRRDRRVNRALHSAGWRVLRVWEHALRQTHGRARDATQIAWRIQWALSQNWIAQPAKQPRPDL